MKKLFFTFSVFFLMIESYAQSVAGITGLSDTSYSVYNEYRKNSKNYPFIKIASLQESALVKKKLQIPYLQVGNRKLVLDVFTPADKAKNNHIVILFIHGGGWRSGSPSMHHPLAEKLALLGYTCITPEYRLSTEALYPAAITDINAAIRWVKDNAKKYSINTSKIILSGHSAGGELAAFVGTTRRIGSEQVNAIIDIDGTLAFIHPESGEGDDSKKPSAGTLWFGYTKQENPEYWKQAGPLWHVNALTPPTLFINSSVARMHAGREDFIKVLNRHHIYSAVKTFEGSPHSFLLFNPWIDSTVACMDDFLLKLFSDQVKKASLITVAQDGTGDYTAVQPALNSIPENNQVPVTIFIKNGIYKEKLLIDSAKKHLTIVGQDPLKTVLVYNDHTGKIAPSGDTIGTRTSWSFKIMAADFTAENISFQNDAGVAAGQAVAVESDGDRAIFKNCRFLGFQDVLFTNHDNSRQFFENCYIEGTTDFIFGSSTVWFENCRIYSKKNSHITAASTPKENEFGYIFNNCTLTGDTSLHAVSLGRPWRPYAQVTYLNCFMGAHIKAEGWSKWNNNDNHLNSRYAEYNSSGPSSSPAGRVSWSRQLSAAEAGKISIDKVLNGWNPLQ